MLSKTGSGLFSQWLCGKDGCTQVYNPISSSQLRVLCVPKFFGNIDIKQFQELDNILEVNKHVIFRPKSFNIGEIKNYKIYGKTSDDDIEFNSDSPFYQYVKSILIKLNTFQNELLNIYKNHKEENILKLKDMNINNLIINIQITFNKTNENETKTFNNINNWHQDINENDFPSAGRQFSILLTHHKQTEFTTLNMYNPIQLNTLDIKEEHKKTINGIEQVNPLYIRQCKSDSPDAASYWNKNVIHKKPTMINMTNTQRIIISIIFDFNSMIAKNENEIINIYNSHQHQMLELNALNKVFGNITSPEVPKIGGKRRSSNKKT